MNEYTRYFKSHIYNRGKALANTPFVNIEIDTNSLITAHVVGTKTYTVSIEKHDGTLDMKCNCPYAQSGENCKHMAAVLITSESNHINIDEENFYDNSQQTEIDFLWLGEERIHNYLQNDLLLEQGNRLATNGDVYSISKKNERIYSLVEDEGDYYQVRLGLDKELKPINVSCTCNHGKVFEKCIHIAAVLFTLQFEVPKKLIGKIELYDYLKFYLTEFTNEVYQGQSDSILKQIESYKYKYAFEDMKGFLPVNQNKALINIEIELTIEEDYSGNYLCLAMKIGHEKMYSLKNITSFIRARKEGIDLRYSKFFTYMPNIHGFAEPVEKFFDYLESIEELISEAGNSYYSYQYSQNVTSIQGKTLYIKKNGQVCQFMKLLEPMTETCKTRINYYHKGRMKTLDIKSIRQKEIALSLSLNKLKDREGYELVKDQDKVIIPICPSYEYVIYQNEIIHLSDEAVHQIYGLEDIFKKTKENPFVPLDKIHHFIEEVCPQLKAVSKIKLPKALNEKVVKDELKAQVYLEPYKGNKIKVKVEFKYGETVIKEAIKALDKDLYIIRDKPRELEILDYFKEYEFKNDYYLLNHDELIYKFLYQKMETLKLIAEVFYDKRLKSTAKPFGKVKGKLGYTVSGYMDVAFETKDYSGQELADIYKALAFKKEFVRLKDGRLLDLKDEEAQEFYELAELLDLKPSDLAKDAIALPLNKALFLEEKLKHNNEGDDKKDSILRSESYLSFLDKIKKPEENELVVPKQLKATLRSYQVDGFKWLKTIASFGMGGILADDMGLGKTLQAISFIASDYIKNPKASLIIAPTSLVFNWEDEVNKFAPWLKILVVAGNKAERIKLLNQPLDQYGLVITSYPLVRRDVAMYLDYEFSTCIIDEAQNIKNPLSKTAIDVKKIRAKHYFALTGTPIENRLSELWSIFDFVMPQYLYKHHKFEEIYAKPINACNKEALVELKLRIQPFLLRRLKKDVLKELPEKIETKSLASLNSGQKKIYLALREQFLADMEKDIEEDGFEKSKLKIFSYLTRLRQVCCHPSLFVEAYTSGSGKMDLLLELLDDAIESGHKIIVFSQFTTMLKLIREELEDKHISYSYLDGGIKAAYRKDIVNKFQKGQSEVFLISLKAGGTGLNLTKADVVIHVDPWWNPAAENQGTDRAHRIGQKKKVQVFKLITKGTIEEKIYELQQKKLEMINSVLEAGDNPIARLTEEEIRSLFI